MIVFQGTAYCPWCGHRTGVVGRGVHRCPRRVLEEREAERVAVRAQLPVGRNPTWPERLTYGCFLLGREE